MRGSQKILALCAIAASSASLLAMQAAVAQDNPIDKISPVTDEMLLNPPDGDWLMWRRTYNGWGYSPLDQINKENVKDLKLAWAWGMTPGGRTQETPLVHDGIMYIQNSTHLIQALDAATGELIWEYQYELPDDVNPGGERNKAIYGDKLIIATRDAHILALDAKTGQLVWDQQVADYKKGWGYSSGPIVANGVIVQGMTSCSNAQPGGCFFTGHDAEYRRGAVARQHHRPRRHARRQQLERHSAGEPPRRFGVDHRLLRPRAEPDLRRRRPALSVERRDRRADPQELGPQRHQRGALHQLHARHRPHHRRAEVVPPVPPDRLPRPRLRL